MHQWQQKLVASINPPVAQAGPLETRDEKSVGSVLSVFLARAVSQMVREPGENPKLSSLVYQSQFIR